ncbi:MAG: hypothetical protein B6229_00195 [Spirochaetaceae bacterium 4572_7]|nr:MAG: hypothetical protein B6229_00195 [Spirochaetaceae bacterium 4572_7]
MKRLSLLIFIFVSFNLYSDDIVNIWADNSIENMGVSKNRVWLKSYFLSTFENFITINTESTEGVLTPITVSRTLYFKLEKLLKFDPEYHLDTISISKKGHVYHFIDRSIQLEFSFGLEKPGDDIIRLIDIIYGNDEENKKAVLDHYLESWVVRIYSGENVFSPDINTLDFSDVLITATIIGEKFQWLWGIHDGTDYLTKVLTIPE